MYWFIGFLCLVVIAVAVGLYYIPYQEDKKKKVDDCETCDPKKK